MEQKTMGTFISALRKANGMTQQELADRLGVSNKAVSRWERDETAPDLSLIPAIAEIFGITCDELLKGQRIFTETEQSNADPKAAKQLNALVSRNISAFKTMIFIAIALAVIGLVGMIGIPAILEVVNDFTPDAHPKAAKFADIGLVFLFVFEIIAAMLTAIATGRMIDTKRNNELFDAPDAQAVERYDSALFRFSYGALWTIFAMTLIGIWFFLLWGELLDIPFYLLTLATFALLILPAFFPRKLYRSLVTGKRYRRKRLRLAQVMDLVQLLFLALSAICFYTGASKALYDDLTTFRVLRILSWGFLACVPCCFALLLWRGKCAKRALLPCGIRNLCLCLSVILFHRSRYIQLYTSVFDGSIVPSQKTDPRMLWLAIGSAALIFVLYAVYTIVSHRNAKKNA